MEERRPKSREIDMCEGVVQNQAGMLVEHTTSYHLPLRRYLYCKTTLLLDVQGMTRPSSSTTLTHASPTLSRTNVEPPREDARAAVCVYSRTCLGLKVLTCKFHALRNACSGLTPLRAIAICRRRSPSSTEENESGREQVSEREGERGRDSRQLDDFLQIPFACM